MAFFVIQERRTNTSTRRSVSIGFIYFSIFRSFCRHSLLRRNTYTHIGDRIWNSGLISHERQSVHHECVSLRTTSSLSFSRSLSHSKNVDITKRGFQHV